MPLDLVDVVEAGAYWWLTAREGCCAWGYGILPSRPVNSPPWRSVGRYPGGTAAGSAGGAAAAGGTPGPPGRAGGGAVGRGSAAFGPGEPAELRDAAAQVAGGRARRPIVTDARRIPDRGRRRRAGHRPVRGGAGGRAGRGPGRGVGGRGAACCAERAGAVAGRAACGRGAPTLLTRAERPRLAELRLQALEARIDADLHLGRHADVLVELRQLTAAEPLRERLHALLMTALYRDGQRAAALAAYQAARGAWSRNWAPSPARNCGGCTREILADDPALAGAPAAAGRPGSASRPGAGGGAVLAAAGHRGVHRPGRELDQIAAAWPRPSRARPGRTRPGSGAAIRAIGGMPGSGRPPWPCTPRTCCGPVPGPAAVHRPARPHPRPGPARSGGGAGRAAGRDRGGPPVPARRPRGPGGAVAGPDGRAASAAGPGQRGQQRPGRAAAARRGELPGPGHQPPSPGRPARRRRSGAAGGPAARAGPRDVHCGWHPAPPPGRPAAVGGAGRAGRATCRWPSRCWPACTTGTRPGRWPTWPPRQRPGC